MKKQEIFDKVVPHLLAQRRKSRRASICDLRGWVCAYKGDDGRSCPIGFLLIQNNLYSLEIEGLPIEEIFLSQKYNNILEFFGKDNLPLLKDLQVIHDTTNPYHWKTKIKDLVSKNSCTWNPEWDSIKKRRVKSRVKYVSYDSL